MKTLKSSPSSSCMLYLNEEQASIASGPNSVTSTRQNGNFVNGPLSIS